ncbi:MAG: DUF1800 domain-containing protein [Gammaproteobacteria bacterium]|nr:DUF1800 domain-containing protein [Gammaproteobacteria bacterium]
MKKIIIKLAASLFVIGIAGCGVGVEDRVPGSNPAKAAQIAAALAEPDDPTVRQSRSDAKRFLDQATYGPSLSEMDRVTTLGFEAWIDDQLQLSPTLMLPALRALPNHRWNEYVNVWWRQSVTANDQLRQRVAFALSEIFVVSARDGLGDEQLGLANYYDILIRNAFGNYRDLLQEVTLSPIMGEYLSMKGNHKPDPEQSIRPDENYARELLQLFSIGLVELNLDGTPALDASGEPVPTYTQETVEAFAHVFTGWNFSNADHFLWPSTSDYLSPMVAYPRYHATRQKNLLRGKILPKDQTPEQDLNQALNNIFNHPNVGPFISRQLIQKLVTSNPSPQYIADVATVFNANEDGERGSLGSVVKAILLHHEARQGHLEQPTTFGKLKEPVLRITSLWRAFEPAYFPANFNYGWVGSELGQSPLNSPSVFNFFTPFYSLPGEIQDRGLVSPEFEIHDETSIIKITNRLLASTLWSHNYQYESDENRLALDISLEVALEEQDPDRLLDHLDILLLGGRMTEEMRSVLHTLMDGYSYASGGPQRVIETIFMIASSPAAAIQI